MWEFKFSRRLVWRWENSGKKHRVSRWEWKKPHNEKLHNLYSSSGSIVSDYGLDDRAIGVQFPAGSKDFSSNLCVQTGSGAHPASCTMGTGVLSPGVKCDRGVTLTTQELYLLPPPSASMACNGTALLLLLQSTYEWQYKWSLRRMKRSPFFLSQYPVFASSNWCRPTTLIPGGSQGCTIPYPAPLLSLQSVSTFHLPQTQTTEGRKWTSRGTCHLPCSHPQYVVCVIIFFFFFSWLRAIGL
jgi:hypothetical protein